MESAPAGCTTPPCGAPRILCARPLRRDRSKPVPRSVHFRTEIGSLPARDRSGSASRLWCQYIWNSGLWWSPVWWFSRLGSYESGRTVAGWLCRCPHTPGAVLDGVNRGVFVIPGARIRRGWWVLHTHARSVSVGTAESRGTAPPVATTIPLPCAQTPLTAHGSPTTTHHDHQKSPSFQQKPTPRPTKTPPSHVQHQQQPHPPSTPTTNSSQNSTELEAEYDRTRSEFEPISIRSTTDFDAEANRTRHGVRPNSRNKTNEALADTVANAQKQTTHHPTPPHPTPPHQDRLRWGCRPFRERRPAVPRVTRRRYLVMRSQRVSPITARQPTVPNGRYQIPSAATTMSATPPVKEPMR